MTTDRLRGIKVPELETWWPVAAAMLQRAIEFNPAYTLEDLHASIRAGTRQLWLRMPGAGLAVVTEITMYPAGRRATIFAIAGELEDGWRGLLRSLEEWAKGHGCKGIDIYGRKGWERLLPDYRPRSIVLGKEL